MQKERFETICEDGVLLKGLLIIPEKPKAIVQFNCGTAAKKEFYLPFLEYLAEHGYVCCLWDYRGSGESAPGSLKGCEYTFHEYGTKDMPAIKNFLQQKYPKLPLFLFGHSAGGQLIGLIPNLDGYKGMVAFAVSTGYMFHMPIGYLLTSFYFFYIFTPISILLTGYLRAKKFGIMEDLPKNVVLEWKAWCSKKSYYFDKAFYGKTIPEGHYQNIPFPIHTFWASDDPISNKNSVPTFWENIKSEHEISFTKVTPKEVGVKEIGHFGFFKKRMKISLWKQGLAKLEEIYESSLKSEKV